MSNIDVIASDTLSTPCNLRYVVVDKETGEIIDDAQGYGYKSKPNAYAAYGYKHRDKSKDKEKKEKENQIIAWINKHKKFMDIFNDEVMECELLIAKGQFSNKPYKASMMRRMLKENNLDVDFKISDLLRVWSKI